MRGGATAILLTYRTQRIFHYPRKTAIREPLTAEEAAKAFGYSEWYFCDRFKDFTGRTFGEYVRHYRLQFAPASPLAKNSKNFVKYENITAIFV